MTVVNTWDADKERLRIYKNALQAIVWDLTNTDPARLQKIAQSALDEGGDGQIPVTPEYPEGSEGK